MEPGHLLLTGGGTGGHIYPAIAIADAVRARRPQTEVLFVGNADGLEASIVPNAGYAIRFVPSRPLDRRSPRALVRTIASNIAGVAGAVRALRAFKPSTIVATGGYVCFPVVLAARLLRVLRMCDAHIALLEPNARPGLTARLVGPLVDEVWAAYPAARPFFRKEVIITGAPVRREVTRATEPPAAREALGLEPDRVTIVVMGGSQGARSINEAVVALVTRRTLPERWQLLHICGRRDYAYMAAEQRDTGSNKVVLVPYLDDPSAAYAAADIVIARAGASTLAELAATGTPSLLVPYPHATDDHQRKNAEVFVGAGAARTLNDAELSGDALWWALLDLLDSGALAAMRSAARAIAPGDAALGIAQRIEALGAHG